MIRAFSLKIAACYKAVQLRGTTELVIILRGRVTFHITLSHLNHFQYANTDEREHNGAINVLGRYMLAHMAACEESHSFREND